MRIRSILFALIVLYLGACGSGGTDGESLSSAGESTTSSPGDGSGWVHFEGVWQGTVTSHDTRSSSTAIVIVNGWGEFRLVAADFQFVGFPGRTRTRLEGQVTGFRAAGTTWSDGTRTSEFIISGSIDTDNFIDATYFGAAGSGSLSLESIPAIDSASIGGVLGTWFLLDNDHGYSASFDFDREDDWQASIRGTHVNGCNYLGSLESWTSINSYDVWELNIAGCPAIADIDLNGEYVGSAVLVDITDDGTDTLVLVLALSNRDNQLTYLLYRP